MWWREALSDDEIQDMIRRQRELQKIKEDAQKNRFKGWQNYNVIGPRKFINTIINKVVLTHTPATLMILFRENNEGLYDQLAKKFRGYRVVNERGVKGKVWDSAMKGSMFMGTVGGKTVAIKNHTFPL